MPIARGARRVEIEKAKLDEGPSLTKKTKNEIESLYMELIMLKMASAEKVQKGIQSSYTALVRTCQGLLELEHELLTLQSLLSSEASVVHSFTHTLQRAPIFWAKSGTQYYRGLFKDRKMIQDMVDTLDALIAERRVDDAICCLSKANEIGQQLSSRRYLKLLKTSLSKRRKTLVQQLVEVTQKPCTCKAELRTAILALNVLSDDPYAHKLLFNAHMRKLDQKINMYSYGTLHGEAYTAVLSQLIFSALSSALRDSMLLFEHQERFLSDLLLWASNEITKLSSLVKKDTQLFTTTTMHLAPASVKIVLDHCSLLEEQGLALHSMLLRCFRSIIEDALQAALKHVNESMLISTAVDDWVVYDLVIPKEDQTAGNLRAQAKISSSAHKFMLLAQDYCANMAPLLGMQFGSYVLNGLSSSFETYVLLLMKAFPGSEGKTWGNEIDSRKVKQAMTDHQQLGILANAYALAGEIFPQVVESMVLSHRKELLTETMDEFIACNIPHLLEWRLWLHDMVDELNDYFCEQWILSLIDAKHGMLALSRELYLTLDSGNNSLEPMPSPFFQEFCLKLNHVSQAAEAVLPGEGKRRMLLARLLETFLHVLLQNQYFGYCIEGSTETLGQSGLQQIVLDMQFVAQIALRGQYLSAQVKIAIQEIITQATNSFSRTGVDPKSILPSFDWFTQVARESITKLFDFAG